MPAIIIKVEGLDRLLRGFSKAPENIVKELNAVIKTSVHLTRPIMKEEAPVDTGKLRRNIYAITKNLTGEVGPNLEVTPYAVPVHEGLGGIRRANRFVDRTATRIKPQVERLFQRAGDNIVKKLIN